MTDLMDQEGIGAQPEDPSSSGEKLEDPPAGIRTRLPPKNW